MRGERSLSKVAWSHFDMEWAKREKSEKGEPGKMASEKLRGENFKRVLLKCQRQPEYLTDALSDQ